LVALIVSEHEVLRAVAKPLSAVIAASTSVAVLSPKIALMFLVLPSWPVHRTLIALPAVSGAW